MRTNGKCNNSQASQALSLKRYSAFPQNPIFLKDGISQSRKLAILFFTRIAPLQIKYLPDISGLQYQDHCSVKFFKSVEKK